MEHCNTKTLENFRIKLVLARAALVGINAHTADAASESAALIGSVDELIDIAEEQRRAARKGGPTIKPSATTTGLLDIGPNDDDVMH